MRGLIAILLPLTVLAQGNPVGNPAGVILGIYGMCGTNPVDCGNGWCCLAGQTCASASASANNPMCSLDAADGQLVVNAAYFGKLQSHQVAPSTANGSSKAPEQQTTNSGSKSGASLILASALTAAALAVSAL
ncbi:hypothetical protein BT63DRAFT_68977 [Microthyrium microscopicum]|uniref:Uncharacterized protein n=1 Tax=Microthyrium microscopicum TaxID=703497 RepID=A0A6A6U1R5_9PEZI|nr:hypothetical protein BT63DRAFT_68977 [Microthyrium microscopicum]